MGWVGAPRPAAPSRPFFSLLSLSPLVPWASFAPSQPPKEAMARKGPSQAQPDCTKSRTIGQQLRVPVDVRPLAMPMMAATRRVSGQPLTGPDAGDEPLGLGDLFNDGSG